jgi:predicted transcriptional regulator
MRSTAGGIYTGMADGYLYADSSDATGDIVLSAAEDIGTAERFILVDIPAGNGAQYHDGS